MLCTEHVGYTDMYGYVLTTLYSVQFCIALLLGKKDDKTKTKGQKHGDWAIFVVLPIESHVRLLSVSFVLLPPFLFVLLRFRSSASPQPPC